MCKFLMVVVMVALAALVFAPAAFAQDDNPTGDPRGMVLEAMIVGVSEASTIILAGTIAVRYGPLTTIRRGMTLEGTISGATIAVGRDALMTTLPGTT
jgi:hypothetical protein